MKEEKKYANKKAVINVAVCSNLVCYDFAFAANWISVIFRVCVSFAQAAKELF